MRGNNFSVKNKRDQNELRPTALVKLSKVVKVNKQEQQDQEKLFPFPHPVPAHVKQSFRIEHVREETKEKPFSI